MFEDINYFNNIILFLYTEDRIIETAIFDKDNKSSIQGYYFSKGQMR